MLQPLRNCVYRAVGIAALAFLHSPSVSADEPLECLIEPHKLIAITSSEIGVLSSVSVAEADVVRQGDTIAALRTDVENAILTVSRARADSNSEIELLRREHEFTVRNRDRVNALNDDQVVSAQDVDEVRTAQDSAWLRLQAALERQHTAKLEAARDELALARRTVNSPIDGVVVTKYKNAGEYVDGDAIVQLAQLDPLRIRVVVPMTMYGQISVGMQATISPELPIDGPFIATVTSIDAMMDAATATLSIRLSLPNPDYRLPAGLKCTVVLHSTVTTATEREIATGVVPAIDDYLAANNNDTDNRVTVPVPVAGNENDELTIPALVQEIADSSEIPLLSAASSVDPVDDTRVDSLILPPAIDTDMQTNEIAIKSSGPNGSPRQSEAGMDACLSLGPFADMDAAESTIKMMNDSDVSFLRRFADDQSADGPWTVMSEQPHEDDEALVRILGQAQVSDYQWLRSGLWEQHMSYGRYRLYSNALIRVAKMQALGFDVQLVAQGSDVTPLWLDVSNAGNQAIQQQAVANARLQLPQLLALPVSCPQLASR